MAQPQLRANYFVRANGEIFLKAPTLKTNERKAIFLRDGGICQECGCKVRWCGGNSSSPFNRDNIWPSAIDHIFPRARGGQNDRENLRLLCLSCNASKGAK